MAVPVYGSSNPRLPHHLDDPREAQVGRSSKSGSQASKSRAPPNRKPTGKPSHGSKHPHSPSKAPSPSHKSKSPKQIGSFRPVSNPSHTTTSHSPNKPSDPVRPWHASFHSSFPKPPSTAPGPVSVSNPRHPHPTSQNSTPIPRPTHESSSGLSSGQIAAAIVVPIVVVLLGICAVFLLLRRRRQNRVAATADVPGSTQSGSSTSMVQVPYYSKSIEQQRNEAPPPPYLSRNDKAPPPRLDSESMLHPPKPSKGSANSPNGHQPPSPSFSEAVFMTNPSLMSLGSRSNASEDAQSPSSKRDIHSSNLTSSPTSGISGAHSAMDRRTREDDEVSAISEDGDDFYDGDTEIEYGEGAVTAEAGMAQRHRASVVDMNLLASSPPKE